MENKDESVFLSRLDKYPNKAYTADQSAIMEGFQYFKTSTYRCKPGAIQSRPKKLIREQGLKESIRLGRHVAGVFPSILRNIKLNFKSMEAYLQALEKNSALPHSPELLSRTYPNRDIWNDLIDYAWNTHKVIVGFTEISNEYIFKGKAIPFKYALVFAQEMKKDRIEMAPKLDAGMEVVNTYNTLGIATNDIVKWLEKKYKIVGMANHPLGGLVDFAPLAEKSGLGLIGRHGMVITKEFGPRCRISPIFIDDKLFDFTDTHAHDWIRAFCSKCGTCVRSCPEKAIYPEPVEVETSRSNAINPRFESYDRDKCFESFASTMGCGICISKCPFSRNPQTYDKMRVKYEDRAI